MRGLRGGAEAVGEEREVAHEHLLGRVDQAGPELAHDHGEAHHRARLGRVALIRHTIECETAADHESWCKLLATCIGWRGAAAHRCRSG